MARKSFRGNAPTLYHSKIRDILTERKRRLDVGEKLDPLFHRDLHYLARMMAIVEARRLHIPMEAAIGALDRRKTLKDSYDKSEGRILRGLGVTASQLGILAESKGNISTPGGGLVALTPETSAHSEIILFVEKMDTAHALAKSLAPQGITVVNTQGNPTGHHREEAAKWIADGKQVFVLTDEDLGGYDVARPLVALGAKRLRLAEFEAGAGAALPEWFVEEDLSYLKQPGVENRLPLPEREVLFALGKRIGFAGPARVELNAQRYAWGSRYPGLVLGAIEARLGTAVTPPRVRAPPSAPAAAPDYSDLI